MTLADRMYMCENENCKKAMRIRQDTSNEDLRLVEKTIRALKMGDYSMI
jgi:hypothetical protein